MVIHPGRSLRATIRSYDFECPETEVVVKVRAVLAEVCEEEWATLTDNDVDALVMAAAD